MNILLLYNDFGGAYGSLAVFQKEMISANADGIILFVSYSAEETIEICKKNSIGFSLAIGEFNQYIDGVPVYDKTGIHHYQWLIDNPLKSYIDSKSRFITYILVNKEHVLNIGLIQNKPIFMPIGITLNPLDVVCCKRIEGIVFSGQIKDTTESLNVLFERFSDKTIKAFIEEYSYKLSDSFEKKFNDYFGELPIKERKYIFRHLNTYFRSLKRKKIILSIKNYPVFIIGDVCDEEVIKQHNVHPLNKVSYNQIWKFVSGFLYSININPNFHDGIHDRVLRSILYGTIPISEESNWCREVFGDNMIFYTYENAQIENKLDLLDDNDRFEMIYNLSKSLKSFEWRFLLKVIEENYKQHEIPH